MTEERKIQLIAEVDTTRTRAGFNEIGQQAGSMAGNVTRSSAQADRAVTEIGNGASAAARKAESAQRTLIASIQRTTVAMEAGGRSTAQYYEMIGRQRGVDASALDPFLAKLRTIEEAQAKAAQTSAAAQAAQTRAAEAARAQATAQRELAQTQVTRDSFLAGLREQIQLYGKSADEVLRYRAAQAGASQESAQLILQLQSVRAAHEQIAEAARAQTKVEREAAQAQATRDSFMASLREQVQLYGKSADEVMRYRAAQAGAAADAAPLIAQLQNLRTAQEQITRAQRETAQAQAGKDAFLSNLREQVQLYGRSADEVLRYRAAQVGASGDASGLILQLQNIRAAHERTAEAARAQAAAQREAQQAQSRRDSFVSGLQQQAEAIGKTRSQLLELQAAQLGVTAQAAPFILKLREAEQGLNHAGMSARATAAALRGVPAQMTDIVTSIQGGQAPLTVFLQQGGQLKDMFGGTKEAAKALGGYLLSLVNPYTVVAAAAGALGFVYMQGAAEAKAYREALILSGNAAGTTAGQLSDMARKIDGAVGTQGAAAEALAALAGTGKVSAANLERFGELAVRAQRALGQSVSDTATEFAELGKAPVATLEKLNEKYHFLTGAIYEHVKSLQDQGRHYEAGVAAQQAYATAFEGITTKVTANLGTMQRFWTGIKDGAKEAWDAMLDVGREDSLAEKLAKVRAEIAKARKPFNAAAGDRTENQGARARLAENLALEASLVKQAETESRLAAIKAEQARFNAADTEWSKTKFQYLTRQQQLETELAAQRNLGLAAGHSDAAIEERLAIVRKKYADIYNAGIESNIEALKRRGAVADAITQREIAQIAARRAAGSMSEDAAISETARVELAAFGQRRAMLEQELSLIARKQSSQKEQEAKRGEIAVLDVQRTIRQIQLTNDLAAAEQRRAVQSNDLYTKGLVAATAERNGLLDRIKVQKQQNEQIGLSAAALADLEVVRMESAAALKDESAAALEAIKPGNELAKSYREQAAAWRELASEKRAGGVKQAAVESAKSAEESWKKTADSIGDALSDNIMRGGKSAAEYIKDLFRTMVLRPVISAIVNPVAGAMGMGGVSGAASAATQGASTLSSAGGILGSIGAATSAFGTGIASGLSAWGAGGSVTGLLGSGTLFACGIANGLGMVAGALGPIALALGAAVAIWKKLDTSGTSHTGGAASASSAGVSTIRAESIGFEHTKTTAETEKMVSALAQGVVGILDSTALAFGKTAGYTAATAFADDTSKDGAWGALLIQKMGSTVLDWNSNRANKWAPKEFSDGEKGQKEYLAALGASVRTALDSIGLPSWAKKMLDGVGSGASIEDLAKVVDQINLTQRALASMKDQLPGFKSMTESAVSALMAASGGIESLATNAGAYYDNFMSAGEKSAATMAQITEALKSVGITAPASREAFRALVEQQMKLGEAGAPAVAMLFKVAGAFAQVYPEMEATANAARSAADVLSERADLQKQYDELVLSSAQLLNKQRMALDASNRGLFDQIQIAKAAKAAQDEAKNSMSGLIGNMRSFGDSARSLRDGLLTGSLSTLTPEQQYAELERQYQTTRMAGIAGDTKAQSNFASIAQAFLTASQKINGGDARYSADFAGVLRDSEEIDKWTTSQIDVAQASLDAMNQQVIGIDTLNDTMTDVAQTLKAMPSVIATPDYSRMGSSDKDALVAEIKSLKAELVAELKRRRADAQQQTGDLITSSEQICRRAATTVVDGTYTAIAEAARNERYRLGAPIDGY